MHKLINFLLAILYAISSIFVFYKTYNWFAPHTGCNLPELSIVNTFSLSIIGGLFLLNLNREFQMDKIYEKICGKTSESNNKNWDKTEDILTKIGVLYIILLFNYIIQSIL